MAALPVHEHDPRITRTLLVYRVLVGALALALLAVLVRAAPRAAEAPPALEVIDVAQRAQEAKRALAAAAYSDTVVWFYKSDSGTAHMHMLSGHQTCPLHVHRRSHEATLILSGTAEVTHVFGDALTRRSMQATAGSLVATPPFCGHAWHNTDAADVQANLVFESPAFDGNLYVADSDPIMKPGAAPFVDDVPAALAAFVTSSEEVREVAVPAPPSPLSEVFVRHEVRLLKEPSRTLLLYVVAGAASVREDSASSPTAEVRARHLVLAREGSAVVVRATEPTALLVFRP
jgi:mannose-6-phosphate isomerase-like protein (cupin superfamily)